MKHCIKRMKKFLVKKANELSGVFVTIPYIAHRITGTIQQPLLSTE
jgi:hypothetical protein